jgi:hypothetical protein
MKIEKTIDTKYVTIGQISIGEVLELNNGTYMKVFHEDNEINVVDLSTGFLHSIDVDDQVISCPNSKVMVTL